jgi:hypothetical protein
MSDITPISAIQSFLASGDTATARTAIELGSVDDTADVDKPISTATLAVTDAITARDWVKVDDNTIISSASESAWTDSVISIMRVSLSAPGYPSDSGQVMVDKRASTEPFVTEAIRVFTDMTDGGVYTSSWDGAAWTDWVRLITTDDDVFLATQVVVTEAAQLSGTLDSSKVYVIDGAIDMGTTQINVPAGGLSLKSTGAIGVSLTSTENNYTMFVDASGDAGNLILERLRFTVSGTSSKVFDVTTNTGSSVFSIDTPLFIACTEIGTLNGFAVLQFDTMQDIACTDGLTIDGAVTLLTIEDGASSGMAASGTVFKQGASLVISNNCAITRNTFVVTGTATLCDFDAANFSLDAGFGLGGNNISGGGTYFSNINGSDVKCRWRDNNFDPATAETNTYVGAAWECTSETATAIGSPATDVKVAGTTTYEEQQWFSNDDDNAHIYDSTRSTKVEIIGTIAISGTNGHDIQLKIRKWDDSLSSYEDVRTIPAQEMSATGAAVNIPVLAFTTLDSPDDRIELWGQNVSNTGDFTMKLNSILTVTERPH